MQQTVYKCDNCMSEIGRKVHISLRFAVNSGLAVPTGNQGWGLNPQLQGKFVHFCTAECIKRYFAELIKRETITNKKK